MRRLTLSLVALCLLSTSAVAQKVAPVWESYLARQSIYREKVDSLTLELLFKKEGGPTEHTHHQMYILAYLRKDESQILEMAKDASLLDKRKADQPMLLDVLLEKKLVAILDSKIGKRARPATQDDVGSYGTESDDRHGKASLRLNTYPFSFTFSNQAMFEAVSALGNFDEKNVIDGDHLYFEDKFKLLVFVPVNDCKYANKVSPELNQTSDVASTFSLDEDDDLFLKYSTPLLYFKPLAYEFEFKKLEVDDRYMIYVN
jgi:hypothetical protein